ncbi:RxLR effector protein, partial [Phytophthora megakarya]
MGLYAIIMIVFATAILTCGKSFAAVADLPTKGHGSSDSHYNVSTKRALKAHEKPRENNEERGGAETLANLMKASGVTKISERVGLKAAMFGESNGVQALKTLQLGDDLVAALRSSKLNTLDEFITKFNKKNPGKEITLIGTLSAHYGDDFVAKTLIKYKMLEKQLVSKWRSEKLHPQAVWKLLDMGGNLDDALSSGKLRIYSEFVADFNKNNPKKKVLLLGTLNSEYGEVAVAKKLITAKGIEATKDIATKLQKRQLKGWMVKEMSPDDVFTLLKIKDGGILSIGSRKLDTLNEYIKLLESRNHFEQSNLVSVLSKGFGGEDEFALLVSRASQQPQSKKMFDGALKYRDLLFSSWLKRKLDPMTVLV